MRALQLAQPNETLSVLCLGAHSDDIEIGAGGTILEWIALGVRLDVHWWVLSAIGARAEEARASADAFLADSRQQQDRARPVQGRLLSLPGSRNQGVAGDPESRRRPGRDLNPWSGDAHQDHREVCQLTWNLFRDHLILEYEIPKWDGDLNQPNVYLPLRAAVLERKTRAPARSISGPNGPKTGSMPRPSAGWHACEAWSAAPPSATPRPSSCAKPCWDRLCVPVARRGPSHGEGDPCCER